MSKNNPNKPEEDEHFDPVKTRPASTLENSKNTQPPPVSKTPAQSQRKSGTSIITGPGTGSDLAATPPKRI